MFAKRVWAVIGLALMATAASADEYVRGYFRKDGTYVSGYYRSSPNKSTYDNYSSSGNTNPYTGSAGSKSYTYGSGTGGSFTSSSSSTGYVNGYTRRDGTYVSGYYRSPSNGTVQDNYSYSGNRNPYSGTIGSSKYTRSQSSEYYDPYKPSGSSYGSAYSGGYGSSKPYGTSSYGTSSYGTRSRKPVYSWER